MPVSHFPYAAQIWRSLWAQESGTQVDGVIATDPVALSYVLKVVGPVVMPDGEKVTADNVVELTESTAYTRFGTDNNARKQYLQNIAGKVVERMTGKISQPQALLEALGRAASEGRLAVWSSHPDEQDVLADTPLGHIVPDDDAPYAGVVVNNLGGNKLDYYLQREIDYTADSCSGDTRATTVKVRLTNTLPPGDYTKYVAGMFDNPMGAPAGTNLTNLSLVATQGAKLGKVTVDGKPAFAFTGAERGHPSLISSSRFRRARPSRSSTSSPSRRQRRRRSCRCSRLSTRLRSAPSSTLAQIEGREWVARPLLKVSATHRRQRTGQGLPSPR